MPSSEQASFALWRNGYRPFFLAAGLFAALAVPLWVGVFGFGLSFEAGPQAPSWHIHEMLFGYVGAVLAGFLLTAIPNWTGRQPIKGWRLMALFSLWLAGRAMMWLDADGGRLAISIDAAFLIGLALVVWRELLTAGNRRNLPVAGLLSLFAIANILHHLREFPGLGDRLGLAVIAMLIALIGGRIVPNFTGNWLRGQGIEAKPAAFDHWDKLALGLTGAALIGWVVASDAMGVGILLLAAGAGLLLRLLRWQGAQAGHEALVLILHLGYAWLGLGLALIGLAILAPFLIEPAAATHALTSGAIATMTMAVMTRATLGHGGRPLHAGGATVMIYAALTLAALLRVAGPMLPVDYPTILGVSGGLWSLAYAGFVLAYAPLLIGGVRELDKGEG